MNLKPYPEYKDSGVAWLGKVPRHWEMRKTKYLSEINPSIKTIENERTRVSFVPMERTKENYPFFNPENRAYKEVRTGFTCFQDNDILIAKITPCFENGKGGICLNLVNGIGFGSTEFHVIRTKSLLEKAFFYYVTISKSFRNYGAENMQGSAGQKRVPTDFIKNLVLAFPSTSEQLLIARFLDYKTAQIARFIKAKKRMIELLKEQKQVIINDAVTGKIDVTTGKPYPKYKDSGVKWLGKVPERWGVRKIKYIKSNTPNSFVDGPFGSSLKSIHYVQNSDVYIVESGFITRGQFIWKDFKTITNKHFATIKRSECKGGDIIIAKIGAYYGMSGILPELDKKAVVSGNSLKLTINHSICNVEYIHYALLVAKNKSAFKFIVGETAQPALSLGGINRICLPLPNMNEQLEITKVIKNKSRMLDLTISRTEREIALMQEYRTRLISDVVTGKTDVRDIEIPDIDDTMDELTGETEGEEELETAEVEE